MNNSYSGNFFPSPLSGKFALTSTPKKTQKKLPRNVDIFEYLEDPSLTILREDMLRAKSFDSVSTQDLERLYWHLRDYSYYCGRISNYDEALETEKLLEYVFLELKDRKSQSKPPIYSEILNPTFFQNQQMKWMQQLINFDEETEKKVESIKDRHTSEIKLLESRWKQSRLRPFNKLSPSLRDLANNEQTASTAGDFAAARSIHDDVASKRKEELKEAQCKADSEYNSALASLKQRQASELDNFIDTRFHKRELLIRKQQNDLDTIEDKANISLYRMNNNKPFPSAETSLPFRGLIRPFIQTNQLNANSNSPKLLPPIRPPPLKNENWSPHKITDKKKVIKCVPKTRHKIDFQNNEFDLINAMEILKRRFAKMTQEKNGENEKNTTTSSKKNKKNSYDDDLFDFNAYYENQRNPAHLKPRQKKKKNEIDEPIAKPQPYFEPVKRKMNFESIMKKVKEKEANKRKPPVIHSNRKPLRPPKRKNKFNSEEEEEEYEDDLNQNESNIQFKQKIDVTASKNDTVNRIIDRKNIKPNEKIEDIKKEIKKSDDNEIKSIEIVKKGRSKPTEKFFSFKEKDKNELKLFFCEQDKNVVNEFSSSYSSYSTSYRETDLIKNNNSILSEKGKNTSSTKKIHKTINTKKSSDGVQREYSYSSYYYNYSDYSFDGAENTLKDRDGNNIIIVKSTVPKENPRRGKNWKKEYTRIIKVDYDYTNIKNEYEEEVEEEDIFKLKSGKEKYKSSSKSKNKKKSKKSSKSTEIEEEKEDKIQEPEKIHKGEAKNGTKSEKHEKSHQKSRRKRRSKKSSKKVHKNGQNTSTITSSTNGSFAPSDSNDKNNRQGHKSHHHHHHKNEVEISNTQNESQTQKKSETNEEYESSDTQNDSQSQKESKISRKQKDSHAQKGSKTKNEYETSDTQNDSQSPNESEISDTQKGSHVHKDTHTHKGSHAHKESKAKDESETSETKNDSHGQKVSDREDSESPILSNRHKKDTKGRNHPHSSKRSDACSDGGQIESDSSRSRSEERNGSSSSSGGKIGDAHTSSRKHGNERRRDSDVRENKDDHVLNSSYSSSSEKQHESDEQVDEKVPDKNQPPSKRKKKHPSRDTKNTSKQNDGKQNTSKQNEGTDSSGSEKDVIKITHDSANDSTAKTDDNDESSFLSGGEKHGKNFSYSKVSHISIKTDKKESNSIVDVDNDNNNGDTHYMPKLSLSSVLPLEASGKAKKANKQEKTDKSDFKHFVTPKPKSNRGLSSDDEKDEQKDAIEKVRVSQKVRIHGTRSIPKRASKSKMSPQRLNISVGPLNDGSLFGGGVETKSSGVVKVKH